MMDLDSQDPAKLELSDTPGSELSDDSEELSLGTTDQSSLFDSPTQAGPVTDAGPVLLSELKIDGFEIIGQTGEGGMGAVLEARQTSLNRRVAVKVLSPEFASRGDIVERFEREAATLARLTHPNIVTILERGQSGEHYYFIMEFVEGPVNGAPCDLRQLIGSPELDERSTQQKVIQIAKALTFAHSEGITHRDIKPSNIMIDRHNNIKVADFGIASGGIPGDGQLTMALSALGTPDYMAPEQRRDASGVDFRADIYSTGVMLYEMLTGMLPIGVFEPPSQIKAISSDWDGLISKAMSTRPEKRWASMEEFRGAVERIQIIDATSNTANANSSASENNSNPFRSNVTEINKLLTAADQHFEQAKSASNFHEGLQYAEQAGLIFSRILKTNSDEKIQKRLNAANRLAVTISRTGAKEALKNRQPAVAVQYLECLIELDPATRDQAAATLKKIEKARLTAITEIRVFLDQGDLQKALAKAEYFCNQSPDDTELKALVEECRRQSGILREFRDVQYPKLRDEDRFCELATLAGELSVRWPGNNQLRKLSDQAAAKVARANQLVHRAQKLIAVNKSDLALKHAQDALLVVADHVESTRLVEEILGARNRLQGTLAEVELSVKQGRWFQARTLLNIASASGLHNAKLKSYSRTVNAGCEAADRHRAFLCFSLVGGCLAVLSGKLALLFRNGLFAERSWIEFHPAIDVASQLVFTWAALTGLLVVSGRRVAISHLLVCVALIGGSIMIHFFPEIDGWKTAVPIAMYCLLLPLLPVTFLTTMANVKIQSWKVIWAILLSVVAVLPHLALMVFTGHIQLSLNESLMVAGLLMVFGLSKKWWPIFPIMAAGFVGDILSIGAIQSEFDWLVEYQSWCVGLLVAATAIVCSGKFSKAMAAGVSLISLFAFGAGMLLREFETLPPASVICALWFAASGAIALQLNNQFDLNWHFIDRMNSARRTRKSLSTVDTK